MADNSTNIKDSNTMQAFWVGIGSFVSFAFTLVSTAILSRYLTKDEYGTYKQVMYVYNTLLMVFTLGLPKAYSYFLSRCSIAEGKSVSRKINLIFLVIGLVFSLLLFAGADIIAIVLNNSNLVRALRLFSLTPLFLLPTMGLESIMAVYKKTYLNAIYIIATRCFMLLLVALPVAFYKADCDTAIIGFTFSSLISCIVALFLKKVPYKGCNSQKTKLSFREIINFSIPLAIASLWAIAIKSADQFYISRYFGNEVFADFSNGSLELPFVGMILGATATVLLPVFSKNVKTEGANSKTIIDTWKNATAKSVMLIYPLVIYCWYFALPIMTFLYGDKYVDSAIYFRIMLVVNLFTIAPYYPIIIALGETKYYANVHMWNAMLVWITELLIVMLFPNPYLITATSVVCHLIKIFIMINFISKKTNCSIYKLLPFEPIMKVLLTCIISGIIVLHISNTFICSLSNFLLLSMSFVFYSILLFLIGKVCKLNYIELISPFLNKIKR